jgi:hypothetical protein
VLCSVGIDARIESVEAIVGASLVLRRLNRMKSYD